MPSDSRLTEASVVPNHKVYAPVLLLLAVGGLLAVSVLLSKLAFAHGMPMLTYLAFAMTGSGAILLLVVRRGDRGTASSRWFWGYSAVAGGLMALGSAAGYLTIHVVGVAFISLAIAFPPLITWALSLSMGMERFDVVRGFGLLVALAGGAVLAIGKGATLPDGVGGYIVFASSIPLILAAGNVFRTRCWPTGAGPRTLAAAMLICGGGLTLPFAVWLEGPLAFREFGDAGLAALLLAAVLTFSAQYLFVFRLQQIAGPVYLSQIGSVSAVFGVPAAVFLMHETLPGGYAQAIVLIILGLILFQSRVPGRR